MKVSSIARSSWMAASSRSLWGPPPHPRTIQVPVSDGKLFGELSGRWKVDGRSRSFPTIRVRRRTCSRCTSRVITGTRRHSRHSPLYDANNIYIGVFAHDRDPRGILTSELAKDFNRESGDDFEIVTCHDFETAMSSRPTRTTQGARDLEG
jgi:hypothetical protein